MAQERINIVVREKGSRVVKRRLRDIGGTAAASAGGVNMLKTALLGIGGALVLRQTVMTVAKFEQALSTVQAVSGATESQLKSLTATARELGATTRFTATQAGEALVELSRAGFEVAESLESVDDTLYLAQAGALDLKRAAELTAGAIRAFRLDASEAGRVTDVYALAANSASTDVNQLGEAMKFVAPAAAGLNVTIEESVAALQALADAQLKGTLGGTGLRQVLIELEAPSSKSRKIMKGLGVSVDDVRISSVGLTTALEVLHDAGISTGQAFRMFGRRGGGAANILLGSVPKIRKNTEELENAGGTAREVARIMDDNLNGALLRVKSAFEAVQLSFGESGGSALLIASLDHIANALRFLAENIEIVQGAVITLAVMALPKLLTALLMLTPALSVLAAGAAIGALVAFRDEIEVSKESIVTLGDFATATWERIREGASTMVDSTRSALPGLSDSWSSMFGDLDLSIKGFVTGTARLLDDFIGLWVGVINVIKAIWAGLGPALKDISISLLNGIIGVFESGLKTILAGIDAIADKIPGVGKLFGEIGELEIIPRLENTAKDALIGMDEAIAKGFKEGGAVTVFEDSVNEMFDRAEQVALDRIANIAIEAQIQEAGPTVPTGGAAPTPQGPSPALMGTLSQIAEEVDLLRLSNSEREIANNLKKIENKLAEQAAVLGEGERGQIENELRRLQLVNQVSGALDAVRGMEIDLAAAQAELNSQVEAGNITIEQAVAAYKLLQNQANETARTVQAGWERGINSLGETISDFATQTENTLVNAFNSAEDALVNFVLTGKMDFKSMVDSILADLTRLIARMLIVKAIESASGMGGPIGTLAGAFGGGKAGGGPVEPGKFYVTGEKGPELFSPSVPGQIIPNGKVEKAVGAEAAAGGGGNVTIINVSSKEEALAAIGSTEGERIIINYMNKAKAG